MFGTERLLCRPPSPSDLPALFAFMGDPAAMVHTHCQPSLRTCRRHVAAHEWRRRRTGIGPWAVLARAEGRMVGWGGLYEDPCEPGWGVELAYLFARDAWGRGYATEFARLCLDVAWRVHRLTELSAFAHPDNAGSRRVLTKVGFVETRWLPEMHRHLFTCRP